MAKNIDYPKASFKAAQSMAEAVDSLGGSCSVEMCAEKMGNKVSGAFNAIVSASQKFKLISHKSGQLTTSPLYKEIKLAYTEEEKVSHLVLAFLSPPVFSRLYERFKGKELPVSLLDKMLIKEYDVDQNAASRIKKYFIEGSKAIGLLNGNNQLTSITVNQTEEDEEETEINEIQIVDNQSNVEKGENTTYLSLSDLDEFVFHIIGPGVNSKIAIREEEDFMILEAMIKKIKKRFDFKNK